MEQTKMVKESRESHMSGGQAMPTYEQAKHMLGAGTEPKPVRRMSAAEEVYNIALSINTYASEVFCKANSKLQPIMRDPEPCEALNDCERAIPEYFDNLRCQLRSIQYHLQLIDASIDRVEL